MSPNRGKPSHADGDGQHHHYFVPTVHFHSCPNAKIYVNTVINPPLPHSSSLPSENACFGRNIKARVGISRLETALVEILRRETALVRISRHETGYRGSRRHWLKYRGARRVWSSLDMALVEISRHETVFVGISRHESGY
ncbi:hypothetical protein SLA2020_344900 [Shorea laevis]